MNPPTAFIYHKDVLVVSVTAVHNNLFGVYGYEVVRYKGNKRLDSRFYTKIEAACVRVRDCIGKTDNSIIVRKGNRYIIDVQNIDKNKVISILNKYFVG